MHTIPRVIPQNTPPPQLKRLLVAYSDPSIPIPVRYRLLVLARIVTLLVAASRKPEGVQ